MEKVTSVKIDNDKWEILKGRGYMLQDIIDNAFNNLLNIENNDDTELIKEIDRLKNENKEYEREKENIKKTFKDETEKLESRIEELKKTFNEDNNKLEIKINDNNIKIKELNESIKEKNIKKENKDDGCIKDYNNLIRTLRICKGNIHSVRYDIKYFVDKWNIKKEADINKMLFEEYVNQAFHKNQDLMYDINDFRER